MTIQKLYSTLKPYAAITVLALAISSLSVSAATVSNENNGTATSQQKSEGHHKHERKMKKHFHRLAKKLDLTKEQRTDMKAIFANMKDQRKEDKATLSGFKKQLQLLMQEKAFDENKFSAIYAEFSPNFAQVALQKAKVRHAIMQILTPEQQKKYLAMRKHR